jgi:prophage regulatory protein
MSNEMSQCRIIRKKELLPLIGLSDTTVWRLEREGKFPKRLQLGAQAVGWRYSDILRWIEDKTK